MGGTHGPERPTLQSRLTGHEGRVCTLAATPDGRRVVSGSEDQTIRVWDLEMGRELRTLRGHFGAVRTVAVTPDGQRAVSGSTDASLRVWDLETGRVLRAIESRGGPVHSVAVTPDGTRAVSGAGEPAKVRSRKRSARGRALWVWDLESGEQVLDLTCPPGDFNMATAVAVTRDGQRVLAGLGSHWLDDVPSFVPPQLMGPAGNIGVWSARAGERTGTLLAHTSRVNAVAATGSDGLVVSAGADSVLMVGHVEDQRPRRSLRGHTAAVCDVALTPDARRAVSGSLDGTVRVWDLQSGSQVLALDGLGGRVFAVGVTPDGRRLIVGGDDGAIGVWVLP